MRVLRRSGEASRSLAVEPLDEQAGEIFRILGFAPRDHAEDAGLHCQIESGDSENRKKNSAGYIFFGIAYLSA